jgi:hypothetical protein
MTIAIVKVSTVELYDGTSERPTVGHNKINKVDKLNGTILGKENDTRNGDNMNLTGVVNMEHAL